MKYWTMLAYLAAAAVAAPQSSGAAPSPQSDGAKQEADAVIIVMLDDNGRDHEKEITERLGWTFTGADGRPRVLPIKSIAVKDRDGQVHRKVLSGPARAQDSATSPGGLTEANRGSLTDKLGDPTSPRPAEAAPAAGRAAKAEMDLPADPRRRMVSKAKMLLARVDPDPRPAPAPRPEADRVEGLVLAQGARRLSAAPAGWGTQPKRP